jgi:hypothetical protein
MNKDPILRMQTASPRQQQNEQSMQERMEQMQQQMQEQIIRCLKSKPEPAKTKQQNLQNNQMAQDALL